MELFVVNRYLPESEIENKRPDEEELKRKLLKKIDERKRKSVIEDPEPSNKTLKEDVDTGENDAATVKKEGDTATVKRKKKKKKKLSQFDPPVVEHVEKTAEFKILGNDDQLRRSKTKRVLPDWLKSPSVVSVDLKNLKDGVDSIPQLDDNLVNTLKSNGITHFFPVQAQVIPWLLSTLNRPSMYWPSDVCVSAPTGSGKTLAFALPIIQALKSRLTPQIRALVVLPVQDLAKQVAKVFNIYCSKTNLKVVLLSNGLPMQDEQKQLVKKDNVGGYRCLVDIIVTTPGRLVDHLKATPGFSLAYLRYLVIDEADRVMEGVQNDWLFHVNKHIGLHSGASKSFQVPPLCLRTLWTEKRPPQKLLFSATLSQDPEKLQQLGLFQPKLFTSVVGNKLKEGAEDPEATGEFVGKFTTPAELKEYYVECTVANKPLILMHLLETKKWKQVLCFTKSKDSAHRLAILLRSLGRGSIKVAEMTATLSPSARNKRLHKFSAGKLQVLVCSDAMARGIDIPNVECVVSYNAPKFIKNHVHRVGRTGRAGHEGTAITLLLPNELSHFQDMMSTGKKSDVEELKVEENAIEKFSALYEIALEAVKKKLAIKIALAKAKTKNQQKIGKKKQKVKLK